MFSFSEYKINISINVAIVVLEIHVRIDILTYTGCTANCCNNYMYAHLNACSKAIVLPFINSTNASSQNQLSEL